MNKPDRSLRDQHRLLRRGELVKILDSIEAGQTVRDADLRGLLKGHYHNYRSAVASNQSLIEQAKAKPADISEYEALLSEADRLHGQMDSLSSRGYHDSAKRIGAKAETAYEKALERLEEILQADPGLQMWLDRPASFDAKSGGMNPDPVDVPRCVTSKSLNNLGSVRNWGIRETSDLVIDAVNAAIEEIDGQLASNITSSGPAIQSSGERTPEERLARILAIKHRR